MKLSIFGFWLAQLLFAITCIAQTPRSTFHASYPNQTRIQLIRSDNHSVSLRITGLRAVVRTRKGRVEVTHNADAFAIGGDSTSFPGMFLTLGIPFDATEVAARIEGNESQTVPITGVADSSLSGYRKVQPLHLSPAMVVRGLKTISLQLRPIQLTGRTVQVDTAFTVVVTWKSKDGGSKSSIVESDAAERYLSQLVLNYDQARGWRASRGSGARLMQASGNWGMGEAMVLEVPADGIYRITGAQLAAQGASGIVGIPVPKLQLLNHRVPVPFHVEDAGTPGTFDSGDYIEFSGQRNRSDSAYLDEFTDTNAYVLSWNGSHGSALSIPARSFSPTVSKMAWYDSTLHFEEDHVYFPGPSIPVDPTRRDIPTIHNSERAVLEGDYWDVLRGAALFEGRYLFHCAPYYFPGAMDTISIRVSNASTLPIPINFALNEFNSLGDYHLPPISDTILRIPFPENFLVNGANKLKIKTVAGDTSLVYFNSFEIKGQWLTSAFDEAPKFIISSGSADSSRQVIVTGLTTPLDLAISRTAVVHADSIQRGMLLRVTSREFDNTGYRINPGFVSQLPNGVTASTNSWEYGTYVAEVMPGGTIVRSQLFNTTDDPANSYPKLRDFLNSVVGGDYVIAGFSVGAGTDQFPNDVRDAFVQLGSSVAARSDLKVAAWGFVAKKGVPGSAIEQFVENGFQNNVGVAFDAFIPDQAANGYRAFFTIAAPIGTEFTLGTPLTPATRFHPADSLVAPSNQADLVVISHPDFFDEGLRLARHRIQQPPTVLRKTASGGHAYTAKVVDVNTIYDEFNDGVKSPLAIRRFLQYADSNWTEPKPLHVLLLGDASSDPAHRLVGTTQQDFVPTWGNPGADYTFTTPFGGIDVDNNSTSWWHTDTAISWNQFIGRIPATNRQQASAVVDKIIEYDTTAPAEWNKRLVFMAGGEDEGLIQNYLDQFAYLSNEYILAPQFQGDTSIIRRTSANLTFPDAKDRPWFQYEVNRGALMVSYSGHGSRDVLDLDYGYPDDLDNQGKYFMLNNFSCETGVFDDASQPGRTERFLLYPHKGAIATYGSTAWTYDDLNRQIEEALTRYITTNTSENYFGTTNTSGGFLTNLGAITTLAKWQMFNIQSGTGWQNADLIGGIRVRNHLVQYSLLGDPSMELKVSNFQEIALTDGSILNDRGSEPAVGDSVATVSVRVWNYGLPVLPGTTMNVVASIVSAGHVKAYDTVEVYGLGRYRDISFHLPLTGQPGEYSIQIVADPELQVDDRYRADNMLNLPSLRVRGNQPLPIEPVAFGRVANADSVFIRLLNAPSGGGAAITVDTVPTFDSPGRFDNSSTGSMNIQQLTTTWKFSIPSGLRSSSKFWWKATAVTGDTAAAKLFPTTESFTLESASTADFMMGGVRQFSEGENQGLINDFRGLGIGSRNITIDIIAVGQRHYPNGVDDIPNDALLSVKINGKEYDNPRTVFLKIFLLDPATYLPTAQYAFNPYFNLSEAQRFIDSVNAIPAGIPVIVATRGGLFADFADPTVHAAFVAAMHSLGAGADADSLQGNDSYALIGGKGIHPVFERRIGGDSIAYYQSKPPFYAADTLSGFYSVNTLTGTFRTPPIGPAAIWHTARLTEAGSGSASTTIFGMRQNGTWDSLLTSSLSTIDLSQISAAVYPQIEVRPSMSGDTALRIQAISVDFQPSPELAVVPGTIKLDKDSILQGDAVTLRAAVANLSRKYSSDSVNANVNLNGKSAQNKQVASRRVVIPPNQSEPLSFNLSTDKYDRSNSLSILLNPENVPAEPYRQNNQDSVVLRTSADTASPDILVYADGHRLMNDDYVSPTAKFEIRIADNSNIRLTDSTSLRVILDTKDVLVPADGQFQAVTGKGNIRGIFTFTAPTPGLKDGKHSLSLQAIDASGNKTTKVDAAGFESQWELLNFNVEHALRVMDVVNYPNPFKDKTAFTFMVSGGSAPTGGEIAVFTISGRKIKTIPLTPADLNIGFNKIDWDGNDQDGDRIANGVYLYRIRIEDGESSQQVIEKLVEMR